jgi:hypothetical protein
VNAVAGVRRIDEYPIRYVVTFTHVKYLDDCELRVVERIPGLHERPYYLCLKHQQTDCKCVDAVHAYLATGGIT